MPVEWVRVRHGEHGGVTYIPAEALESYRARGWQPVGEFGQETAAEPTVTVTTSDGEVVTGQVRPQPAENPESFTAVDSQPNGVDR